VTDGGCSGNAFYDIIAQHFDLMLLMQIKVFGIFFMKIIFVDLNSRIFFELLSKEPLCPAYLIAFI
jgi:Na+/H+ antiporter NhaB